jgi:acyl-CoA thioesterase FadM
MNLYLRLLFTVLKALRAPRVVPGDAIELTLRVLPTDLDLNGHMNNGRYLTIVDLALATLFIRSGFGRLCLSRGWRPVGGGSIVRFQRELNVLQQYTLRMTMAGWDEYWSYLRFEFIRGTEICAAGYVKGAARGRGGLVRSADIYPVLGYTEESPALPEEVLSWIVSDRVLGAQCKQERRDSRWGA